MSGSRDDLGKIRDLDERTATQRDEALDRVAKLPDVARPPVRQQRVEGFGRQPLPLSGVCRRLVEEMPDEQRNVRAPFAQWRHANDDDAEAVVQVASKPAV